MRLFENVNANFDRICKLRTVKSEILARVLFLRIFAKAKFREKVLFLRIFAKAKFRENKTLVKWQNPFVAY